MNSEITLIKNNNDEDLPDLEWVNRLYNHLVEEKKLSRKKAFGIVYYLQEHVPVFPDHIEQCDTCKELYDSYAQGHHSDLTGKNYCCESCEPRNLYEREKAHERKIDKGFQRWLKKANKQKEKYPAFKGRKLNENYLYDLFLYKKTPIEALNDLLTVT